MLYNVMFIDDLNREEDDPEPIQKVYEKDTIAKCVDNPEVLESHGISTITVLVKEASWHICKVEGFSGRTGAFTRTYEAGT